MCDDDGWIYGIYAKGGRLLYLLSTLCAMYVTVVYYMYDEEQQYAWPVNKEKLICEFHFN